MARLLAFATSVALLAGCSGSTATQSVLRPQDTTAQSALSLSGAPREAGTDILSQERQVEFRQLAPDLKCPLGPITVFQGPAGGSGGVNISPGLSFDLWYGDVGLNAIIKLTKRGAATAYTIPTTHAVPEGIAKGPNLGMWFTEWSQDQIGSVSAKGKVTELAIKLPKQSPSQAVVMIQGPDKRMWFGTDANGIGVHKVGGKTVFYDTQIDSEQVIGLADGPDGKVWYTTSSGPHIGKMTTSGVPTNYNVGASGGFGLSAGADGRMWFADANNGRIGAINTDGSGLTYYSAGLTGQPFNIVKAPDGNLYFVTGPGNAVGRITTAGVITECHIKAPQPFVPLGITIGSDKKVWFLDNQHSQVGTLRIP
jgi:virginiamycin B lyase